MSKTLILFAFCGGFILFGLAAAGSLYVDIRNGGKSLTWPTAEGTITYSARRRGKSTLKRLEYEYAAAGAVHTASRAAFLRTPYVAPTHEVYREGQRVAVRYDPADPARAVLEPGAPLLAILAHALVPVLLIGFGSAGLYYGLRR